MIKPTKLIIKNIGKIAEITIEINKPLILFYGEIKQGKSTILNCVRWVCGGEFPDDIIQHGRDEGEIELHFDGGMISRSFYRAKDKSTKARPVALIKGYRQVASPVAEIKRFLNPFLLDQDFLRNKSEVERKQYFTEVFAVDTTALDSEFLNIQRNAQSLRAKIAGCGKIDLVPVEAVDVSDLKKSLADMIAESDSARANAEKLNGATLLWNFNVTKAEEKKAALEESIADRKRTIKLLLDELAVLEIPKRREVLELPPRPDTSKIEALISDGAAQNVRAEQYQKDKVRADQKTADEEQLSAMENRQREIKASKQAKLKEISDNCGIDGLAFDDSGNFIYEGTTAGMISDSQLMKLSSALSSLYPDGFGLDLLDRAESLGKSIFEYVERAKAEKKTIMATIVGERPAKVSPEIGVFVVENGILK